MSADQMPEFPGGQSAMLKFMTDNFRMLPGLPNEPLNGTLVATFVVNPDGKVSQVEIVRKMTPTLDAEMVRVVSAMPTWKPGMHQGVPVAVRSSVPLKVAWKGFTPSDAITNIVAGHLTKEPTKLQATPEFPGGEKALWEYMKEKKASLEDAKLMKVAGVFEAEFLVTETGKVKDIYITRALHPDFSKVVLQAINEMPAWKPARQKGKAVPAIYSFAYEVKEGVKLPDVQEHYEEKVYLSVEQMPQFMEGEKDLRKFFKHYALFPEEAKTDKVEGTLVLSFVVDANGKVKNVEVVQPLHPVVDQAMVKILLQMPAWIPGAQNRKKVPVKLRIPFMVKNNTIVPVGT